MVYCYFYRAPSLFTTFGLFTRITSFSRTNLENCNKLLFTYASLYRHQATLNTAVSLIASDPSTCEFLKETQTFFQIFIP